MVENPFLNEPGPRIENDFADDDRGDASHGLNGNLAFGHGTLAPVPLVRANRVQGYDRSSNRRCSQSVERKPDPAIRKSPNSGNGSPAADRNGYTLLTNRRRLLFAGGAFHADGRIFRGTSVGARSPPLGTPRFAARRGRGGRAGDHPRPV